MVKYRVNIFVLFYVCGVSSALAGVVLCDNGYFNGTECVPYVQDNCVAGYTKQSVIGSGIMTGVGCAGVVTQGKGIYVYSAFDTELCDNGYFNGTECVPYVQDNCVAGYTKQSVTGSGIMAGVGCTGVVTQGKGIYAYSAFDTELCDNGYFNGAECVPYVENTDVCPGGYNEISDVVTFRAVADGLDCPSGTITISAYDGSHLPDENQMLIWSYPYTGTPDNMIALRMCGAGQEMNYLGNCANLCAASGVNYLRSDTGVTVPVYASKITTPSLNIKATGARACYVNLLPESSTGAINVKYNDAFYHTVN